MRSTPRVSSNLQPGRGFGLLATANRLEKKSTRIRMPESVAPTGKPNGAIRSLMDQVRAEYAEMPGLSVTLRQAQRLWTVDRATCDEAFRRLLAGGVLRKTTDGRFVRA